MAQNAQKDVFEGVLPKAMQTIRAASALGAQDVNFYKSIDAKLLEEIDRSSRKLMELTKKVIQIGGDDNVDDILLFGKNNIEGDSNWKPLADVLDNVFERLDNAFDNARKGSKVNKEKQELTYLEDGNESSANSTSLKNFPKPQLNFKVAVDNSETSPFRPKISSKPHALRLFEESTKIVNPEPKYEDSVEIIDPPFYPHPYEFEIDHQPYPDSILERKDPIPSNDWNTTTATWVATPESLEQMISDLRGLTEIAVDLEHHDFRTYYGIVCLMQISNRDHDWIVDTLTLRDDLEPLNEILTNPQIVKVFHGAFMDIIWLQRDLGLYIVSLFDTYHASRTLGFPKFSLAYLLETFANFKTSKKYQLADWRLRPLIPAMMSYARSDTHFLLNIFDQLRNKLIDLEGEKLQKVLFDSRQVAKRRFEFTKFRPLSATVGLGSKVSCPVMSNNVKEPYSSILVQYNIPHHKKQVVEVLYNWRDLVAKKDDESTRFVMSNQLLVSLANLNQPVDANKVLTVSNYVSEHVRLNARELALLLENTLKETEETDWDLVDQWKEATAEPDDDLANIDAGKVSSTTQKFEKLWQINSALLKTPKRGPLLTTKSNLFATILDTSKTLITAEFDLERAEVIKHDFTAEYNERLSNALEGLEEIERNNHVCHKQQEIEVIEVNDPPQEKQKPPQKQQSILKDKSLDPNEVITIRNKKSFHNRSGVVKASPAPEEAEPSLDYVSADKIMLDSNKKDRRDNKKKKREFDPYGKDSEGPQPSKKARRMNVGKTSTFTKKRK